MLCEIVLIANEGLAESFITMGANVDAGHQS